MLYLNAQKPLGVVLRNRRPPLDEPIPSMSVRTRTFLRNFLIRNFSAKNPTPNIHLHHPFPYKITRKLSHKGKYFSAKLIQDENRERVNIY